MNTPTRDAMEGYEMSQSQVANALLIKQQTVSSIEKRAASKFRELFEQRGVNILDLLED